MANVILWGTGKIAGWLITVMKETIVLVVDNNEEKWGNTWHGYVVSEPDSIIKFEGNFDKIIIATRKWEEIQEQIIKKLHIAPGLIDNMYYRQKEALLNEYKNKKEFDKYTSYLQTNPLDVFNDNFVTKYKNMDNKVYFDPGNSLYYVFHNNKRMYFSKKYQKEEQVRKYYTSILIEQDPDSPHRYQTERFHVCQGDTVLDAGAAEGNFALDIIDLADKIYLVEADEEWIEALEYTFESFKNKVEIIKGFAGSGAQGTVTIDNIIGEKKIDFIKMDIEGSEVAALCGAKKTLEKNNVKLDICAYHAPEDEEKIKKMLKEEAYHTETSDGFMIFMSGINFYIEETVCPQFVRGIVRGYKENCFSDGEQE